jgi:ComF family protein
MVKEVIQLFFPKVCVSCSLEVPPPQRSICLNCELDLPRALLPVGPQFVEKVFWGRLPLVGAYAWLRFRKDNRARDLLHNLKYGGNPELVREMGRRFALELVKIETHVYPDVLVPVPLHPKKLKVRGYNQAELIALGMADVLKVPVVNNLLERVEHRTSLTKLGRTDRWEQIQTGYRRTNQDSQKAQHFCLVDDVITTGATIEACGSLLLEEGGNYLSIASLAYAERLF